MNTYGTPNTANYNHRKENNFLVSKRFTVSFFAFTYHPLSMLWSQF